MDITDEWTNQYPQNLCNYGKTYGGGGCLIRVQLVIEKIFSPDAITGSCSSFVRSSAGKEVSLALQKISNFLTNEMEKRVWHFFGYIDGTTKVRIMISYYEILGRAVYTLQSSEEEKSNHDFFPNFSLN